MFVDGVIEPPPHIATIHKKNNQGQEIVFLESGKYNTNLSPLDFAKKCIKFGCGEILLNDIDREGTWKGLNIYLAKEITKALDIPIIIHGGACSNADIINMIKYLINIIIKISREY